MCITDFVYYKCDVLVYLVCVLQMYQKNESLLAECLSEKITEVLSAQFNEEFTVMDLFVNASKLFKFETVTIFLKSMESHLIPFLITCDHAEIHQVFTAANYSSHISLLLYYLSLRSCNCIKLNSLVCEKLSSGLS